MQLNTNIFTNLLQCKNGTVNGANEVNAFIIDGDCGNPEIMYRSGLQTVNNLLDESISPWLINPESCLHYFTFRPQDGDVSRTAKSNANAEPLLLICGSCRYNTSTYKNVVTGGSQLTAYETRDAWSPFNSNYWTVQGSTPLWYLNAGVTGTGQHFTVKPFILDFDYNGVLLTIHVDYIDKTNVNASGVGAASTATLADYIATKNTQNNEITGIWFTQSIGTSTLRYGSTGSTGVNASYNGAMIPFLNKKYSAPTALTSLTSYPVPDFFTPRYLGVDVSNGAGYGRNRYDLITFTRINANINGFTWGTSGSRWINKNSTIYEPDYVYLAKSGADVYTNDDFDYIRREIAYIGFWFSDGDFSGTYTELTTPLGTNATDDVYMSVIDENGITTGEFIKGSVAKDTEQATWGTDFRNKNGYNGRVINPEQNKDRGNLKTTLRYSDIPSNTKNYALTNDQLQSLITWCNNGFNVTDSDQFLEDFKGLNPSDCIISAIYFPFNVGSLTSASIHVGNLDTGITAEWALYGANAYSGSEFSYSPITINREYNDFRDFAPYTTIDIYIPFCGAVSLNPADVYGYDLTITIIPDLNTGSCTGCVYRGDYLLTTKDGQIGMPIALSLGQVGTFQNAVKQAQYNLQSANNSMFTSWLGACASVGAIATGAGAGVGIAGLAGSAMGILNADRNIKKAEYDLEHISRNFNTVGTVSDVNNVMVLPEYVHCIIKRPYDLPDIDTVQYGHTVGFACNKQGQLKDFAGYTVISDCDLSGINCTASEKESIDQILKRGVIV